MRRRTTNKALIYTNHDEDFLNSRVSFFNYLTDKYSIEARALVPVGAYKKEISKLNLSVGFLANVMRLKDFWKLPILLIQLTYELITYKPNFLFTYKFVPNLFGVILGRFFGVDFICVTLAGLGRFFSGDKKPNKLELTLFKLYISVIDRSDLIVVQNFEDLLCIQSWCKSANIIQTDGSGVDELKFDPNYLISEDFLQDFNLKLDSKYFLYCGRIMEEKGVFELIEGFKMAKRLGHLDGWELIIAGWFPKKKIIPKFNDQIRGFNTIHFLGYINDIRPLLKLSSVSVLPTHYPEGVPRILIESLAFGLPIITTHNKGSKETCSFNNGFILNEKSITCVAECLMRFEKLSVEEYREMSINSRSLFENRFCNIIIYKKILMSIDYFDSRLDLLDECEEVIWENQSVLEKLI
jgi:glycosyltransferase involved in cell wall biosynthesis